MRHCASMETEQRSFAVSTSSVAPATVLLVEDDPEIAGLLSEALREHGFEPTWASSGAEMQSCLRTRTADVLILDIMLPGESGLDLCRGVRSGSKIPILILTALGSEIDKVLGLEMGADDYVVKPFSSRELIARIRALIRRSRADREPEETDAGKGFEFRGWRVLPSERQVYDPIGVRVSLTSAEFDLLVAFCSNPGRVLSREQLLELTHGGAAGPMGRSIDVHISRVRQKLENERDAPEIIKTVRLGGYIFTPEVRRV
jgi:two-component system, OmpR family, response regulator